jgi:hypothetical protein
LGADLNDTIGLLCGGDHGEAVCGAVRHGLFAVDIFARGYCVDQDLLMPVVGYGNDDGVDFFVVEQFDRYERTATAKKSFSSRLLCASSAVASDVACTKREIRVANAITGIR